MNCDKIATCKQVEKRGGVEYVRYYCEQHALEILDPAIPRLSTDEYPAFQELDRAEKGTTKCGVKTY